MVDPSKHVPTTTSDAHTWTNWYKQLDKVFSQSEANTIWLYAYDKRGRVGKTDADTPKLRSFMAQKGVDLETNVFGSIYDTGADFLGGIGDIFGSIGSTIKFIIYGVMALVLLGGAWILFNVGKKPETIASMTPAGMLKPR